MVLTALSGAPAFAANIQYVYDDLGRLVAEIDPDADTTLYTYDAAGNLLSVSRRSSSQFSVVGFSPARGKAGDAVSIAGSGFVADPAQNSVSFNGTPATVSSATTTTLVVVVPASATSGPITVSNANGSASTVQAFTVVKPAVVASLAPGSVARGQTTRIAITGTDLDSAKAITFAQAGITARILPGQTSQQLTADLAVAGSVPFGTYGFTITNYAGTSQSGAVTLTVTALLVGDAATVTRPASVYLPAAVPGAPAGNAMTLSGAVGVHLPAVIPGAPPGDSMSVSGAASVYLPAVIPGAPDGNAMSVTGAVSVNLPALIPGAPAGDSMTVTQPASVSMP